VEIIQSHSATVSALDSSRSFMVIVDPRRVGAALLKDTLEVIVTDRAGHADTVTYGVVYHTVARTKKIKMNTTSAGNGAAVFAPVTTFPMLVRLDKTTFDFSTVNNAGSPIGLINRTALHCPLRSSGGTLRAARLNLGACRYGIRQRQYALNYDELGTFRPGAAIKRSRRVRYGQRVSGGMAF